MAASIPLLAVISVPKFGVVRHVGLLLPNGLVAHCAPHRGEHQTTLEEFANGQDVTINLLVPWDHWGIVLARISEALRRPRAYHALQNNCEMFVNRMLSEQPVSPQLQTVGAVLILVALGKIIAST